MKISSKEMENDPYFAVQKILSGKWTLLILHFLGEDTLRFNELQRRLGNLSHVTLAKHLKELEKYGLLERTEFQQIPPKVEYSLSISGKELLPALEAVFQWGHAHMPLGEVKKKKEVE